MKSRIKAKLSSLEMVFVLNFSSWDIELSLSKLKLKMAISCSDGRRGFIWNLFWDPEGMQFLDLCLKLLFIFFLVEVHFDAVW